MKEASEVSKRTFLTRAGLAAAGLYAASCGGGDSEDPEVVDVVIVGATRAPLSDKAPRDRDLHVGALRVRENPTYEESAT